MLACRFLIIDIMGMPYVVVYDVYSTCEATPYDIRLICIQYVSNMHPICI